MELRTERLILREFAADDVAAVHAYQGDARYLRFYPAQERTEQAAREMVELFVAQQREEPRTKWHLAMVRADSGRLIGNVGVRQERTGALEADLGYEVAPEAWGRGYATEAARAMQAFAFTGLLVHRLWASCIADNVASVRVLEKLGLRREGCLRHKEYFKRRWWDVLIFGQLDDEWRPAMAEAVSPRELAAPARETT